MKEYRFFSGPIHRNRQPTPFADLFASFPDDGTARELYKDEKECCEILKKEINAKYIRINKNRK